LINKKRKAGKLNKQTLL